jgi:hypothetical protein
MMSEMKFKVWWTMVIMRRKRRLSVRTRLKRNLNWGLRRVYMPSATPHFFPPSTTDFRVPSFVTLVASS